MVASDLEIRFEESPTIDGSAMNQTVEKLKVPTEKKRRVKSPTPARAASTTPTRRSRSKTPFAVYLARYSEDPTEPPKWRSITPFINRQDKERTPFELGKDIKTQLISHKMVFDKASVMDISEADFEPVRYITSDVSVIDRASVMDISNVEVIYLVEEYDEEELVEEEKPEEIKKKKGKKGKKSKSVDKEDSPLSENKSDEVKKTKKKVEKKRKEESRSPSPPPQPKLTLKLELGGGSKMNKKMFENKPAMEQAKPPPKKSTLAMQMEEKAKEAAKAAQEAAQRETKKLQQIEDVEQDETDQDSVEEDEDFVDDKEHDEEIDFSENEQDYVERRSTSNRKSISQVEEDIQSIHSDNSPDPETEPTRSPSPQLPPPRPAAYWKKIAAEESEDFMQKMKFFNSVVCEKPNLPVFVIKLKDICATETNTIRMVCAVAGPDLTYKWYKDDVPLKFNDRYNFVENDNILSLQIYDCIPSDTADYSCTISNKHKKITSTSYVNVCEMGGHQDEPCPPVIEFIEDSYHYIDDKLIIESKIKGIPRPTVTWSKDGYEIVPSKEYTQLEGPHGTCKIIINHPSPKDSGIYVVSASNSRGVQERRHCVEFLTTRTLSKIKY